MLAMTLSLVSLLQLSVWAWDHYPEERTYTAQDKGYEQYGAPSLHHTGQYALTFDDGPHPQFTPKILDDLKAANAKATFFVLTSKINAANFPIIKRILDEGHILASHGLVHDNSNQISKAEWKSKVKQSILDLARFYRQAGHELKKIYYRFPYAAYGERKDHHHLNSLREISQELMGDNCIHFAFWDFDSSDWVPGITSQELVKNLEASHRGGDYVTYRLVKKNGKTEILKILKQNHLPTNGGVILQHDIQASSADGTRKMLEYMKSNQLKVVRLDEVEEFKITRDCTFKN
jgi:peptidoglycan/xylan/chitin deacetylase (PgdA/CDA1 family)